MATDAGGGLLSELLHRLYAALSSGPSLNCRPHSSRQRLDLTTLASVAREPAEAILARLLAAERSARIVAPTVDGLPAGDVPEDQCTTEQKAAQSQLQQQQAILAKLRHIAEDARTFEQDTGAHVLHVGFPLLSLPKGSWSSGRGAAAGRVLAPLAFVPVHLAVVPARAFQIELACAGDGIDRLVPNAALLAWVQRQTGKPCPELGGDERGDDPYREVQAILEFLAGALKLATLEFGPATPLVPAPRAEEADAAGPVILPAAKHIRPLTQVGSWAVDRGMLGWPVALPRAMRGLGLPDHICC